MSTALQFVLVAFAIAFLMFAALAWKISPIVFVLMRSQFTHARMVSDLMAQAEKLSDSVPDVTSAEITQLKERITRLEKKAEAKATTPTTTRRRRKVTA